MIKRFVYLLLASLTMSATIVNAFETTGLGWAAGEATFHVSALSTTGSGLSTTELSNAFAQAMDEWSTKTAFNYQSTSGSADPCAAPNSNNNPSNNDNGYMFDDHACFDSNGDEIAFGSSTLAVAITWRTGSGGTGPIIQSGVVFNGLKNWDIYNGSNGSANEFRRVAVHELGHSLGLGHSSDSSAIMWFQVSSTEVLQTDDLDGAEFLYGEFDSDGDGVGNAIDNCVDDINTDQADFNNDGQGDVCDNSDADSLFDDVDNCPLVPNQDQADFNNNGQGDVCEDTDGDSVFDDADNCRFASNQDQADFNNDDEGDVCDNSDGDTLLDNIDNCPSTTNQDQADLDGDGDGNACDNDADGDSVLNGADNDDLDRFICSDTDIDSCDDCSSGTFDTANDGHDSDGDGICNNGEVDDDGDGIEDDAPDNCQFTPNPDQQDSNNNGVGDACEEDELCLPIKTANNKFAVICL